MKDNTEEATMWAVRCLTGWWLEEEEDHFGYPVFSCSVCWAKLYPNKTCAQQTADKINQYYEDAGSPVYVEPVKVHVFYEVEL